jgi:hypothetical protein
MNQRAIKIYLYPLMIIILSIVPWWAFSTYILKFNFISFLASSTKTSRESALIFILIFISVIYFGWTFLNMWIENSKVIEEKEKRIEIFF